MYTKQDILRIWESHWGELAPDDRVTFLAHPALGALAGIRPPYVVMAAIKRYRSLDDAATWVDGIRRSRSQHARRTGRRKASAPQPKPAHSARRKKGKRQRPVTRRASHGAVLTTGGASGGPQRPHDAALHRRIGPTMRYGDDT